MPIKYSLLLLISIYLSVTVEVQSSLFDGRFFKEPTLVVNSTQIQCYNMQLISDDSTDLLHKALQFYEENISKAFRFLHSDSVPKISKKKVDKKFIEKLPLCSELILQDLYEDAVLDEMKDQGIDMVEMALQAERENLEINYPHSCEDFSAFAEFFQSLPLSMQLKGSIKSPNFKFLMRFCFPIVQIDRSFELTEKDRQLLELNVDKAADL